MPNGTYGGVRGKETKVGQKTFVSRPTRLFNLQLKLITKQSCHTVPYGLSVYEVCTVLTYGHASQDATVTCSPFVGTY